MKSKKTPERFSIRFDASDPNHKKVINILIKKGRKASKYIVDAILAYESQSDSSLESTVTEVVNKILNSGKLNSNSFSQEEVFDEPFDFDEILEDLEKFKK